MTDRIAVSLIGAAGVHYVCMELTLRGLLAMPTIRNASGVDVLVTDPRRGGSAKLQVKTSQLTRTAGFPTSTASHIVAAEDFYFVYVRRLGEQGSAFEAFLFTSSEVRRGVEAYATSRSGKWNEYRLPTNAGELEQYRQAWLSWRP